MPGDGAAKIYRGWIVDAKRGVEPRAGPRVAGDEAPCSDIDVAVVMELAFTLSRDRMCDRSVRPESSGRRWHDGEVSCRNDLGDLDEIAEISSKWRGPGLRAGRLEGPGTELG
jgi:hypothetical protein